MSAISFPRFIRLGDDFKNREPIAAKILRENAEPEPQKRILFLEDHKGLVELLNYGIFPSYNVKVETAETVAEAKQIMEEYPVAAAILDIRLNESDSGVDLYKWIADRFPRCDVCFLTAHASDANKAAIEAIGPARVFAKGRLGDDGFVTSLLLQFGVSPR